MSFVLVFAIMIAWTLPCKKLMALVSSRTPFHPILAPLVMSILVGPSFFLYWLSAFLDYSFGFVISNEAISTVVTYGAEIIPVIIFISALGARGTVTSKGYLTTARMGVVSFLVGFSLNFLITLAYTQGLQLWRINSDWQWYAAYFIGFMLGVHGVQIYKFYVQAVLRRTPQIDKLHYLSYAIVCAILAVLILCALTDGYGYMEVSLHTVFNISIGAGVTNIVWNTWLFSANTTAGSDLVKKAILTAIWSSLLGLILMGSPEATSLGIEDGRRSVLDYLQSAASLLFVAVSVFSWVVLGKTKLRARLERKWVGLRNLLREKRPQGIMIRRVISALIISLFLSLCWFGPPRIAASDPGLYMLKTLVYLTFVGACLRNGDWITHVCLRVFELIVFIVRMQVPNCENLKKHRCIEKYMRHLDKAANIMPLILTFAAIYIAVVLVSDLIGLGSLAGSFVAGLMARNARPLIDAKLRSSIQAFSTDRLVPAFYVAMGMGVDYALEFSWPWLGLFLLYGLIGRALEGVTAGLQYRRQPRTDFQSSQIMSEIPHPAKYRSADLTLGLFALAYLTQALLSVKVMKTEWSLGLVSQEAVASTLLATTFWTLASGMLVGTLKHRRGIKEMSARLRRTVADGIIAKCSGAETSEKMSAKLADAWGDWFKKSSNEPKWASGFKKRVFREDLEQGLAEKPADVEDDQAHFNVEHGMAVIGFYALKAGEDPFFLPFYAQGKMGAFKGTEDDPIPLRLLFVLFYPVDQHLGIAPVLLHQLGEELKSSWWEPVREAVKKGVSYEELLETAAACADSKQRSASK